MQKVFVMYKVKPESRSWQAWQETAAVSGMAQVVKDWDNYGDAWQPGRLLRRRGKVTS